MCHYAVTVNRDRMEVMMITVNVDDAAVPLGRVTDGDPKFGWLDVVAPRFPEHVRVHIWNYGIRQILNDAIADKTDKDGNDLSDEEIVAKATKRLEALYAGELRVTRSAEPVDPVDRVLTKLARDGVARLVRGTDEFKSLKPEKGTDRVLAALQMRNGDDMTWDAAIAKYIAANPKLRGEAERLVKQAAEAESAVEL